MARRAEWRSTRTYSCGGTGTSASTEQGDVGRVTGARRVRAGLGLAGRLWRSTPRHVEATPKRIRMSRAQQVGAGNVYPVALRVMAQSGPARAGPLVQRLNINPPRGRFRRRNHGRYVRRTTALLAQQAPTLEQELCHAPRNSRRSGQLYTIRSYRKSTPVQVFRWAHRARIRQNTIPAVHRGNVMPRNKALPPLSPRACPQQPRSRITDCLPSTHMGRVG